MRCRTFQQKQRRHVIGLPSSMRCTAMQAGLTYQTHHDLAEQHVFQGFQRPWILVIRLCEPFERLEEVGIGRFVVFVIRIESAGLEVELSLEERWAVD